MQDLFIIVNMELNGAHTAAECAYMIEKRNVGCVGPFKATVRIVCDNSGMTWRMPAS